MTVEEVKSRMMALKITQTELARRWGIRSFVVNKLINRQFTSKRLEKKLARAIRVTLAELRASEPTNGKGA